jgi:hypothetical protein
MAKSLSVSKVRAAVSRLVRGVSRSGAAREIKARLAGLSDAVAGWLLPGWPGGELQPVRIRGDRGGRRRG